MAASSQLKVVIFGGGRGAASILKTLVGHPQVQVTALINAYDDGLSTGRLRQFVPRMLGPSDIRKNIGTLMPSNESCERALKDILDYRFPKSTTRKGALTLLHTFAAPVTEIFACFQKMPDPLLAKAGRDITISHCQNINDSLQTFLAYESEAYDKGREFDYSDCSLGNLIFSGCYLACGKDFNRAIERFSRFCRPQGRILNITDGRNYVLVALRVDGSFVPNETLIVSTPGSLPIDEIFLLEDYLTKSEADSLAAMDLATRREKLDSLARFPRANPEALAAIASANLIIYGPGTQHSSLFPSYHTVGVADAIAANHTAEKVFVGNLTHDHDIADVTVQVLIDLFLNKMNRVATEQRTIERYITKLFIQQADNANLNQNRPVEYVPFDLGELKMAPEKIQARDWDCGKGLHAGGQIVDEVLKIAENIISTRLKPLRHTISVIVPVLNEARTLNSILERLCKLDFSSQNVICEIVVIDGGSNDNSFEIACSWPGIRVYKLHNEFGRGAAFRLGVQKARGNVIVLFPADDEYSTDDILPIATPIIENQYTVVFGSRAVKCNNLGDRIRSIYGNRYFLFLMSKYGGMALSILSLLLYDRYISDIFSTIKAYDKVLLNRLNLRSCGVNLECEILGKILLQREYVLEVPVGYKPRTKAQGKKTTLVDGFAAMWTLFRFRFSGFVRKASIHT